MQSFRGWKIKAEVFDFITLYAGRITILKCFDEEGYRIIQASTIFGIQGGKRSTSIISLVQNQGANRPGALGYIWQSPPLSVECTRGILFETSSSLVTVTGGVSPSDGEKANSSDRRRRRSRRLFWFFNCFANEFSLSPTRLTGPVYLAEIMATK